MTKKEKQIEWRDKIIKGLEKVYDRLNIFKKEKNSELVAMEGDKIIKTIPK